MRPAPWPARLIAATAAIALFLPAAVFAQDSVDPITEFPRTDIHVAAWPGGKKVAVSFALFVEEFGFGQGPVYRPDLASRTPDLVNENFRQYSLTWGNLRVARLFKDLDVPLTVVLNAEYPQRIRRRGRSSAQCSQTRRSSPTA